MFVSDCLDVNAQGHLTIGGLDTVELAKEFGTPVYIMDENQIRQHCRDFVESMNETYSGHGHVLYASKAFSCKEMCRICKEEGCKRAFRLIGFICTVITKQWKSCKWRLTQEFPVSLWTTSPSYTP